MPVPQLDESLKLSHCPRCDYSLQGLPDSGICPECGEAYSQEFIVLRGRPLGGDEPNGQQSTSLGQMVLLFATTVLAFAAHVDTWIIVFCIAMCLFHLLVNMLVLVCSVRSNEVLAWLCQTGVGQQRFVDADTPSGRFLWYYADVSNSNFIPSYLLSFVAIVVPRQLAFILIVYLILLIPGYLLYLGRRPKLSRPASGIRPALLPWKSFGLIEIDELGSNSCVFWARKSPRIHHSDIIKIEFNANHQTASNLYHVIRHWAQPGTLVQMTQCDQKPGPHWARDAGLIVRNFLRRGT